ncbi:Bifunctional NAD(P)H-hydrate repair enzyme Nnr [compost metagenome]
MIRIFSAKQQKHLDEFTIQHEPISSVDLMNRAARAVTDELIELITSENQVVLLCGTGNNGGDGLAAFRYLKQKGIPATCYLVSFGKMSDDCEQQFKTVEQEIRSWDSNSRPVATGNTIVIDALLGLGANREPAGVLKEAIEWINAVNCPVYSIDLPSGLPADELPSHHCIVRATQTWTFHAPKLTFLLPETAEFVGDWKILDIGLDQAESLNLSTNYQVILPEGLHSLLSERKRFSHKGTYGHGLLIAGSDGKMGACLLSSEAALRSGMGLLTVHTVLQGKCCLHQRVPEAMAQWDINENELSGDFTPDFEVYSAVGIGPGTGTSKGVRILLERILLAKIPSVIDADALNILAAHPDLMEHLHENCILTPHPKEFERLAGGTFANSLDRLDKAIRFAADHHCCLVLKDAITAVIHPNGRIHFNTTGNPGMAKGGSGDVLTGIILSCITQGMQPFDAARLAVFHHGLAGDKAKELHGERAMLPRDLITNLHIG